MWGIPILAIFQEYLKSILESRRENTGKWRKRDGRLQEYL